jgi:hypothetical protein
MSASKGNKTMESITSSRPRRVVLAAIIAVLFGAATLITGGATLFIDGSARAAAGNYVPFVLWFNVVAGFFYILAGIGLFLWRGWAVNLSMLIAAATLVVFAALGLHILLGGDFEFRTVAAMVLRSSVWLAIALVARAAWRHR